MMQRLLNEDVKTEIIHSHNPSKGRPTGLEEGPAPNTQRKHAQPSKRSGHTQTNAPNGAPGAEQQHGEQDGADHADGPAGGGGHGRQVPGLEGVGEGRSWGRRHIKMKYYCENFIY